MAEVSPKLRRENRIRSIHASLAIENNTLSLSQVIDIIDGKPVIGLPNEIKEVRNAVAAYEILDSLDPTSTGDFLTAHRTLMIGLASDAGRFRRGGVGIYQGARLVHMAPPADRVPHLMKDLCRWLKRTDTHPLLAGAVMHYEIEFIHPFSDGNGRMGRMWQTLVLSRWKPRLANLPIETVVHANQADYYAALAASDKAADAAPFAEFILDAMLDSLRQETTNDPVGDPVSDPVSRLLAIFRPGEELAIHVMMERLGLKHRTYFRRTFLNPALGAGKIAMTVPESPHHPKQRYKPA
jgi:Fic family protein